MYILTSLQNQFTRKKITNKNLLLKIIDLIKNFYEYTQRFQIHLKLFNLFKIFSIFLSLITSKLY